MHFVADENLEVHHDRAQQRIRRDHALHPAPSVPLLHATRLEALHGLSSRDHHVTFNALAVAHPSDPQLISVVGLETLDGLVHEPLLRLQDQRAPAELLEQRTRQRRDHLGFSRTGRGLDNPTPSVERGLHSFELMRPHPLELADGRKVVRADPGPVVRNLRTQTMHRNITARLVQVSNHTLREPGGEACPGVEPHSTVPALLAIGHDAMRERVRNSQARLQHLRRGVTLEFGERAAHVDRRSCHEELPRTDGSEEGPPAPCEREPEESASGCVVEGPRSRSRSKPNATGASLRGPGGSGPAWREFLDLGWFQVSRALARMGIRTK